MSIMELPDREFVALYHRIIDVRFPTDAERRRYNNIQANRPRISKADADAMLARLAKYDKQIRIKLARGKRLKDQPEGDRVDWKQIEDQAVQVKQTFNVRMILDGQETTWPVTAFDMRAARRMVLKEARESGKAVVFID